MGNRHDFIIHCLLIGLSRIVLQDHYPTDVLGGYSIGLIWSFLWLLLYDGFNALRNARLRIREKC